VTAPALLDDLTVSCVLFGRFFLYFRVGMLIWSYGIHLGRLLRIPWAWGQWSPYEQLRWLV
jgi:hypothetical protein